MNKVIAVPANAILPDDGIFNVPADLYIDNVKFIGPASFNKVFIDAPHAVISNSSHPSGYLKFIDSSVQGGQFILMNFKGGVVIYEDRTRAIRNNYDYNLKIVDSVLGNGLVSYSAVLVEGCGRAKYSWK